MRKIMRQVICIDAATEHQTITTTQAIAGSIKKIGADIS